MEKSFLEMKGWNLDGKVKVQERMGISFDD
jgi:hypothetical protein